MVVPTFGTPFSCLLIADRMSRLNFFTFKMVILMLGSHLQRLAKSLGAGRKQVQSAKHGFTALVAFFGENPMAVPNDSDFWRDITAFVAAFSAAQQAALALEQVPDLTPGLHTMLEFPGILTVMISTQAWVPE